MSLKTVIDHYIQKQQDLSVVDQFAILHDQAKQPLQAVYYSNLIPLGLPGENQQFAFEVDLDECTGCKACVSACHSLNGLEENETWREVGFLHGVDEKKNPIVQHVTTACHHCLEPGCMQGCPVKAYEKDPVTGIVHHLDDQCIGCQYCTLMCPYDVPQYSKSKGIVRKCNMCSDRLLNHEAPACVQACPNQAIKITIVDNEEVLMRSKSGEFVAKAPDPAITKPTTLFKRKKPLPQTLISGDWLKDKVQHAHMPLVLMLVLTQLSVGTYWFNWVIETFFSNASENLKIMHATVAFFSGILAFASSTLHLGRPQYAFRSFLGIGTSWMSREIAVFGIFAAFSFFYTIQSAWIFIPFVNDYPLFLKISDLLNHVPINAIVLTAGTVGVFCSAMIYHSTKRIIWDIKTTGFQFLTSLLLLGLSSVIFSLSIYRLVTHQIISDISLYTFLFEFLGAVAVVKITYDISLTLKQNLNPSGRSASLLRTGLADVLVMRFFFGVVGGIILPVIALILIDNMADRIELTLFIVGFLPLLFNIIADILGRYLFFTASVPNKMPGGKL